MPASGAPPAPAFFALVGCILLVASFAPLRVHASPAPAAPRTLEGTVRDQTGAVLPGASVILMPLRLETTSDADGRFRFDGLEPGHYYIRGELAGFGSGESKPLDLTADMTATLEILLSPTYTEAVAVTATRTRVALADVPVRTDVVPLRSIEQTAPLTLADALAFNPGVRVESNCQNCNFSQVRLLGLDGAYTQILIDGQPVVGSLAQVYGIEQIPARMMERVEIVKGGGSALYGSGSVGGVVNVITREPSSTGGSFSTHIDFANGVPIHTIGGTGDWVGSSRQTLVTAFGQLDGRDAIDLSDDGFSEFARRRLQTAGGRVARYALGGRGKLTVDGHVMHEYRRGGDNLDRPEPEALIAERVDSNGVGGNVTWAHTYSPRLDYRVTVSTSHISRDTYYGSGYDPNAFGDSTSLVGVLDTQVNHYLPKRVLSWGIQASSEHLQDSQPAYNRLTDETYRSVGIFAQDAWTPTKGWQILTGLRVDKPNTLESPGVSPRVAIMWSPRPSLTARTSVATGFRAPQVFDEDLHILAVGGEVALIENAPGLVRETSVSVSSGLEWKPEFLGGTALLDVSAFHTKLGNLFAVQEADNPATPDFEFVRVNAKGGRVYGLEANVGWGVGSHFVAQVGVVEQRARYDEAEPDFSSRDFFRTPQRSLIGLLTWKGRIGDVLAAARYTGSMVMPHYAGYIEADRLERTPTFFEVDLNYARRLTSGRPIVTMRISAQNITNAFQ
ncbi:MAG: TonB-dependent receptor, partial [Vicinamibacterales bacterium]|nr:TonB-dependent receptor [Vicinamibacterales bacterium]